MTSTSVIASHWLFLPEDVPSSPTPFTEDECETPALGKHLASWDLPSDIDLLYCQDHSCDQVTMGSPGGKMVRLVASLGQEVQEEHC